MRANFWGAMWQLVGLLSLASMWHFVRHGPPEEIGPSLFLGIALFFLGAAAKSGFFSGSLGNWRVYTSIVLGIVGVSAVIRDVGISVLHQPPEVIEWSADAVLVSMSALFFVFGVRARELRI